MLLINLVIVLLVHWIADFCLQTSWQANNKYKDIKALSGHCVIYTIFITSMFIVMSGVWYIGLIVGLLNGVLHMLIDSITSKITHKLYELNHYHNFFCVIGFDQFLHLSILITSLLYLKGLL